MFLVILQKSADGRLQLNTYAPYTCTHVTNSAQKCKYTTSVDILEMHNV